MITADKYKEIIEKMVTSNRRFPGNEDLYEDFCSEAFEKSLFILKKSPDINKISGYLNRIVSNAIIDVLKASGRVMRISGEYKNTPVRTVSLENPLDNGFLDIKDPAVSFVDKITQEETLSEIYDCILKFDRKEPDQKFGVIFYMKYVEGKKQKEIASTLGISQGEVSKRLFDLMQKISNEIG